MRIESRLLSIVLCLCALSLNGCGNNGPPRKNTAPVTGRISVDGAPAAGVRIVCHPEGGMDQQMPSVSESISNENGEFEFATYEAGDGIPAGKYSLTFEWGQINPISNSYSGDKLGGRYADPAKSENKIEVEEGLPLDLGEIQLKTK